MAGGPFPIQRIIVVLFLLGGVGHSSARESIAPVRLSEFFVVNAGQYDARVRFVARGARHATFVTDRGVTLALAPSDSQRTAINLALVAAAPRRIELSQPGDARVHVLTGRDSRNWKRNLVAYREAVYRDAWPGIDAVVGVGPGRMKYEFRVQPGADPSRIQFRYEGADGLRLGDEGELRIDIGGSHLLDEPPHTFQQIGGRTVKVSSSYVLTSDGRIGFAIGDYDRTRPLIIDPTLVYASYLGSSGWDEGTGVAVDSAGSTYVTGFSQWVDFPVTPGAYQTFLGGQDTNSPKRDAFVTKVDASGALVYSTYFGGTHHDEANSIAVDGAGNAYITGMTTSTDFPVTPGAFQATNGGISDAFVVKLGPTGSTLGYSTLFGGLGPDVGVGIAVDPGGRAFVAGRTRPAAVNNLPGTGAGFQPAYAGGFEDGFLIRMSPDGAAVEYGTYLGGSGGDTPNAVAIRGAEAFVVGQTTSVDLPTTAGAYRRVAPSPAFKTHDGGANWGVASGLLASSALALEADPFDPSVVFAGTDGRGIYKSTTGGDTFFYSGMGIDAGISVYNFAIDRNSAIVYAATSAGVYKSVDAGASWLRTTLTQQTTEIAVAGNGTVIAGAFQGVWRSTDGGASWPLALDLTRSVEVVAHPLEPATIYAASSSQGLFRSLDSGVSWAPIGGSNLPQFLGAVAVDPLGNVYVSANDGAYKSVDGGVSFATLNAPLNRFADMAFDPSTSPPTLYAAASDFYLPVVKSTDGGASSSIVTIQDTMVDVRAIAVVGPSSVIVGATRGTDTHAFAARINTAVAGAGSLVYATYIAGMGSDSAQGVAVDAAGRAYVAGATNSADFPVTQGSLPRTSSWLAKLHESGGGLLFSTFVGDVRFTDTRAVALDNTGNAYVAGLRHLPAATPQPPPTNFVSKFSPAGALIDTLSFGGRSELGATGVAVGPDGLVSVVGSTQSTNFPTTPTAFQPEYGSGQSDAFVARVSFPIAPPGAGNIALNKPVFASSSLDTGYTPDRAVDGSSLTRWSSEFSDPQWIAIDLGGFFSINRVVLRWESAYSAEYQLLISDDGQNWRTVLTKNKDTADVDDLSVSGVGRYIGIYSLRRGTPWGNSLWEFEVYGVPAASTPINLALNAVTAASSSFDSGFTPNLAVDGNLGTRWSSVFSDPQWFAIDLGRPFSISRVVLRWEGAYAADYDLMVSDDAQTWRTVLTKNKNTADVDDLGVSEVARYVGIYSLRRGTEWGNSLWEFEVYGAP